MTEPAARPTFVLVHGNAGSSTVWTRVRDRLDGSTWAAPELPGFGPARRIAIGGSAGTGDFARYVIDVADDFGRGPVVLAGNGLGSILCGHAALRLGDACRGIVMTGPVGLAGGHASLGRLSRSRVGAAFLRLAGRTFGRRKFLRDQLAHPERDPEACAILLDALARARGFHLLARLNRPESLAGLRDLRCPVTVLWGDRDGVLPVTHAQEFLAYLPPHARLEVVPDAGHALPLERPEVVVRALRDLE